MVDNSTTEAVKQILADIDAAWNSGDAEAFAAQWAEEGTVVSPMGEVTESRADIQKDMTAQLAGPMKGTTHTLAAEKIYAIDQSMVIVDGEAIVAMPGNDPWPAKFSAVLHQDQSGKWAVHHMRSYIYLRR
jgi:uncharacterized protein (TIGR02246 family)